MYRGKDIENIKVTRAGIIPYTVTSTGHIWFLLARHNPTEELSDFGGGSKKDETLLQTAHREFMEETREIFSDIYPDTLSLYDKIAILDKYKKMALIFVPVGLVHLIGNHASLEFKNSKVLSSEVLDVLWVDSEDFCRLITDGKLEKTFHEEILWDKIRAFFRGHGLERICHILNTLNNTSDCSFQLREINVR